MDDLERACYLTTEGRYAEAEKVLRAILEGHPDNAPAHRQIGLVLSFSGDFDAGIAALKRAVELDPSYVDARCDLALAYSMLGFMDEGRDVLPRP